MAVHESQEPRAFSGTDYQAIIDSLPDALLVLAQNGTIVLVNAAAEHLFGYSRQELVGRDHRGILAEGYRLGFQRLFKVLRSDQESGHSSPFEAYGLRKDGTEFKGEIACALLDYGRGPVHVRVGQGHAAP